MQMEDMVLVSVDDHIVEPPNLFEGRVPSKFKGREPVIRIAENNAEHWFFEGIQLRNIGLNAVAGRVKSEFGWEPSAFNQMREGTFTHAKRIGDMNADGVLAQCNFPSFPGYCGKLFLEIDDKELSLAILQAYNDWHIDEWCGSHPGRFIPMALVPLWDINLAVKEAERVAAKGVHSISFSENPHAYGLPTFHSDHWDPLWKVCCDHSMVINMHIGSGGGMHHPSPDSPIDVAITTMPVTLFNCASDIVFSPLLRKFPNIKMALSEGGAGWVPHFLERADYVYKQHSEWTHQDFGDELPSDTFKRSIITCFISDEMGVKYRDDANVDMMTWESDYPHSDSPWPNSPEALWSYMKDLPDDVINKITHQNAMREYHLDSFNILGRENCTVGALRAQAVAAGVDTTPVSYAAGVPPKEDDLIRPITATDISRQTTGSM